ncbi:hypothetical protein CAOG_01949 [Capsaspora owczarzaki ATCC 30864]|uniref:Spindle pole body component n=1 Tax=Capsaspora owczarzaki (strain ATCC 30864) TaxID=595528 RepID=A0A0D2X1E7_CAPO3|nr:hypothetical protein CAOG_01949 [Capsaspora owczarzaki ATCC 30864]KJE90679.1 hypothetical protein CAOG_001949 [Capsaspora owczarzaki ATCC 30864]|eukprot:XP_004364817.1 hypothetical protein CAOG_01949 [Capsaspora owczarzaki ATCC 30864]
MPQLPVAVVDAAPIQRLLGRLVTSITGLRLDDTASKVDAANFELARKYASSNFKFHRFPDTNSHRVRATIAGLVDKLTIQSEHAKAEALQRYYGAYLRIIEAEQTGASSAQRDEGFEVLQFLISLSQSPTHADYHESPVARQSRAADPSVYHAELLAELKEDLSEWEAELALNDALDEAEEAMHRAGVDAVSDAANAAAALARSSSDSASASAVAAAVAVEENAVAQPTQSLALLQLLFQRQPFLHQLENYIVKPYWTSSALPSTDSRHLSIDALQTHHAMILPFVRTSEHSVAVQTRQFHSNMAPETTLQTWLEVATASTGLSSTPAHTVISETVLLRECIWLLLGARQSVVFTLSSRRFNCCSIERLVEFETRRSTLISVPSVRTSISVPHLSPASYAAALDTVIRLCTALEQVRAIEAIFGQFLPTDSRAVGTPAHGPAQLPLALQGFAEFCSKQLRLLSDVLIQLENDCSTLGALAAGETVLSEQSATEARLLSDTVRRPTTFAHVPTELDLTTSFVAYPSPDSKEMAAVSMFASTASNNHLDCVVPNSRLSILALDMQLRPWIPKFEHLAALGTTLTGISWMENQSHIPPDNALEPHEISRRLLDESYAMLESADLLSRSTAWQVFVTECFLACASPCLHVLGTWMSTGSVHDLAQDMFFELHPTVKPTDSSFWSDYATLRHSRDGQSACPRFLQGAASGIVRCGLAVVLSTTLEATQSKHPGAVADKLEPAFLQAAVRSMILARQDVAGTVVVSFETSLLRLIQSCDASSSTRLMQLLRQSGVHNRVAGTVACDRTSRSLTIFEYITAVRRIILMEAGEVWNPVCHTLFSLIASNTQWRDGYFLTGVLHEHLPPSMAHLASVFSIAVSESVSKPSRSTVNRANVDSTHVDVFSTDCMEVVLHAPWPATILMDDNTLAQYNRVFQFLLRVKHAKWALDAIRPPRPTCTTPPDAKLCAKLQRLQHLLLLTRHKLQHFVNAIHPYLLTRVLQSVSTEFQSTMAAANFLDDFLAAHRDYVQTLVDRCLLHPQVAIISDVIGKVLNLALQFAGIWVEYERVRSLVYSGQAAEEEETLLDREELDDEELLEDVRAPRRLPSDTEPSESIAIASMERILSQAEFVDGEFHRCHHFAVTVLNNIAARGSLPHFEALAFMLRSEQRIQPLRYRI